VKYGWVDIGSSFLPSDIIAAFLFAQLENLEKIQIRRNEIWRRYYHGFAALAEKKLLGLPLVPGYATNNAHMFYVVTKNLNERTALLNELRANEIHAVFHYLSLHKSPYYLDEHDGRELPNADYYTDCLLRLPLYFDLTVAEQGKVINAITGFYGQN